MILDFDREEGESHPADRGDREDLANGDEQRHDVSDVRGLVTESLGFAIHATVSPA